MNGMRGRYRRDNLAPCGTPAAWRRHHARGEYPCIPCADAWNAYVEQNRERRIQARRRCALYRDCLDGLQPAEALATRDRENLIAELHARRWTDVEIGEHTRTTLYTVARIRDRLGLSPNRPRRVDLGQVA